MPDIPQFHPFANPSAATGMSPPHNNRMLQVGGGTALAALGTAGAYKLWRALHPEEHEELPAHVPEEMPKAASHPILWGSVVPGALRGWGADPDESLTGTALGGVGYGTAVTTAGSLLNHALPLGKLEAPGFHQRIGAELPHAALQGAGSALAGRGLHAILRGIQGHAKEPESNGSFAQQLALPEDPEPTEKTSTLGTHLMSTLPGLIRGWQADPEEGVARTALGGAGWGLAPGAVLGAGIGVGKITGHLDGARADAVRSMMPGSIAGFAARGAGGALIGRAAHAGVRKIQDLAHADRDNAARFHEELRAKGMMPGASEKTSAYYLGSW